MKKRINIVLLIFVLGLWGVIIYRYVNHFFSNNEVIYHDKSTINMGKFDTKGKDTFELKILQRDPFLNKASFTEKANNPHLRKINLITKNDNSKPDVSVQMPHIDYLGYIKSLNSKNELVLIKINNKLLKLRANEVKEGVKIININKDSIQILFNTHKKYIKRNK